MRPESENRPHTILVAFFDQRSEAAKATEDLVSAGIDRDHIRLLPEQESSYRPTGTAYDYRRDEGGFWASLSNLFLPDEDRYAYAEGMSRGGVTVGVWAHDAEQAERASDILEAHGGAVDMEERERSWRSQGWPGYSAAVGDTASAATGAEATGATAAPGEAVERIPIAEEQLRIGKRQVSKGRVRVRAYVVEVPVQEQVTLREEHVQVERRPVDRPLGTTEADLFRERTVEAEERAEEPVVSKDVRVKEELVIHKEAAERVETVHDTVRRTEVEVEDERRKAAQTGGTGLPEGERR